MSNIDAIILAGAPPDPAMCPEGEPVGRAMIRVGDKTMLQWVVDALRGSPSIGRIAAVGSVSADGLDMIIEPGDSFVGNIRRGIEELQPEGRVLIASSDIPLLTSEAVEDFIVRAERLDADLAYPILPRSHCEKRYPGLKRTYLKTADGVFTGGNIMLVSPGFVTHNWAKIEAAHAARKHVAKLARMIGLGVLLRVLAAQVFPGLLPISIVERAAGRMVQAKVAAVVSAYPEIGQDVDKPSDLEAVRRIMANAE